MKTYEKLIVPEHTEDQVVSAQCDLCDTRSKGPLNWAIHPYETRTQVSVSYSQPVNGRRRLSRYEADICPICFQAKLIPWLNSLGVRMTITEETF